MTTKVWIGMHEWKETEAKKQKTELSLPLLTQCPSLNSSSELIHGIHV